MIEKERKGQKKRREEIMGDERIEMWRREKKRRMRLEKEERSIGAMEKRRRE